MLEPKRVAFKRKCRAEQRQTDRNKVFKMCRSYTMCWEAGVKTTVISTMHPDSKPPQQPQTEKIPKLQQKKSEGHKSLLRVSGRSQLFPWSRKRRSSEHRASIPVKNSNMSETVAILECVARDQMSVRIMDQHRREQKPCSRLQRLLWRAREAVITMMTIVVVMIKYMLNFSTHLTLELLRHGSHFLVLTLSSLFPSLTLLPSVSLSSTSPPPLSSFLPFFLSLTSSPLGHHVFLALLRLSVQLFNFRFFVFLHTIRGPCCPTSENICANAILYAMLVRFFVFCASDPKKNAERKRKNLGTI